MAQSTQTIVGGPASAAPAATDERVEVDATPTYAVLATDRGRHLRLVVTSLVGSNAAPVDPTARFAF